MKSNRNQSKLMTVLPLILLIISIPLSLVLWLGNMAFTAFWLEETEENIDDPDELGVGKLDEEVSFEPLPLDRNNLRQSQWVVPYNINGENKILGLLMLNLEPFSEPIPPTRWLFSILVPICFASYGLKKKSLSISGASLGLIVGFILTLSSYLFLACLITFFLTSSRATKFRSGQKQKLENEFKEGGQRNWVQVLCNGGMATQLALLYILDSGCGEKPIDFYYDYRASWLSIGILGSFACTNGDTWASELGTVLGSSGPFLITTGRRVPKGTNGGVSLQGLVFSLLGGLVVGLAYYVATVYLVDPELLARSPAQWPVIVWAVFAGLAGSVIDSLLGATVQFSGLDMKTGCVVECPGAGVKHISGVAILDNHSVNLVSSVVMGLLTPVLAHSLWP